MATETKTTTYKIVDYRDGTILGEVYLTDAQYRTYERRAQWPEGIIRDDELPGEKVWSLVPSGVVTVYLD